MDERRLAYTCETLAGVMTHRLDEARLAWLRQTVAAESTGGVVNDVEAVAADLQRDYRELALRLHAAARLRDATDDDFDNAMSTERWDGSIAYRIAGGLARVAAVCA